MITRKQVRQVTWILLATTMLLILPNLGQWLG